MRFKMKTKIVRVQLAALLPISLLSMFMAIPTAGAASFTNAGFEDGTFTGWNKGAQTGTLGTSITGNGTGVTIFTGSRTFTHGSRGAVGSPTSPYYAPAVTAGSWTFSPKDATKAVLLQPKGEQTFSQATGALGLSTTDVGEIQSLLVSQAQASGNGGGTPTDAAWITREVQLTAGETYTMAWNYIGTDYVPYNDGSITSLVPVTVSGTPVITVNNYVQPYALLGFTNPGTGDYSTNSYGSTGWQTSTYEVSVTGTYKLGFASFNLDDQGLPPALMVDSEAGSTQKCVSGTCTTFGGVEPNNETAPTVAPTTTAETTTTSTTSTTTTTLPPAPTSLVVTSLDDTTSSGTLRWAITQANATVGGIYDSITFDINGTITLTSALPQITQNLTITGNGRTQTIIDGNNLYRPFNIASAKSLTVSDMTLKQGQATNGGLIFNGSGTVVATNIRFTAMSGGSAVFNNNNGSRAVYTNCTFDYLNNGIAGDYGSTPQLSAGATSWVNEQDSVFTNRTYVDNCVFSNNNAGIYNYRFTRVNNSTFTNNGYAANITGLNRSQVLNSTFSNNGIAVYHNAWIPSGFNMGTDNRLITGNTFTNNNMAIYLDDGYNNNQKTPRWATVTNNSFDENGVWITYYLWNGVSNASGNVGFNEETQLFVHSANTSVAPPPTTTTSTTTTSTSTTTTTVVPTVSTVPTVVVVPPVLPEPETIYPEEPIPTIEEMLPEETGIGETLPEWPVETVPSETETEITVGPPYEVILPEEGEAISTGQLDNILEDSFTPNADADEVGAILDTLLGAELTNAQFDNVLEAVFTDDVSADVFTEALTTMLGADITSAQLTAVLDSAFSEDTSAENMVSALESIFNGPISSGDLDTVMNAVFDEDISVADTMTVLGDLLETNLSMSEAEAVFDSVFDGDLSDAETIDLIVDVLKDGLTAELLGSVLGAVFDEAVSTEVLIETFTAVLDGELNSESIGVIVNVLESDTITSEQVGQVVTLVIEQEGGIESGQATELATSAKVLESIDGEQASAVFNAIVVSEVSEEVGAAISEALTEASVEVKESFEEEINVFAGVFDSYVATGSTVDVGTRRSVIAVNLVTNTVALAAAAGGIPGSSSGSTPSAKQDIAARKEEEEEEGGAIEGEGPDWIKAISIYKLKDGVKVMDWMNFIKKFWYGILSSGFTLAGATVMYFTLSGLTQQIALWGTVLAFTGSMYLHMKEPDSE
jgi:hypothetical protein